MRAGFLLPLMICAMWLCAPSVVEALITDPQLAPPGYSGIGYCPPGSAVFGLGRNIPPSCVVIPTPGPTSTPAPTNTPAATSTPSATQTPVPTPTSITCPPWTIGWTIGASSFSCVQSPTPTNTATPTQTFTPTSTATTTPSPVATAQHAGVGS